MAIIKQFKAKIDIFLLPIHFKSLFAIQAIVWIISCCKSLRIKELSENNMKKNVPFMNRIICQLYSHLDDCIWTYSNLLCKSFTIIFKRLVFKTKCWRLKKKQKKYQNITSSTVTLQIHKGGTIVAIPIQAFILKFRIWI